MMRENNTGMQKLLLLLLLLLFVLSVFGQSSVYPVHVTVSLPSPYSLYLSDYVSGSRERLVVTLLNRDARYQPMPVRLRLTVKGNGFSIRTRPYASVSPLLLEPNVPYRLTPEDLRPYFDPRNLSGQGPGGDSFLRGKRMPEGMVEFGVEALEYNTGKVLSRQGTGTAWLALQKPPLLSLPFADETVPWREPLNLLFQWTPQSTGSARVEYELIIKELWDNGTAPESAFAYSPEIFRERLPSTSYLYGIQSPPLEPGHRYAWAVRVVPKEGADDERIVENDGLSEIRSFRVGRHCPAPTGIRASAGRGYIRVEWEGMPQHLGYAVSYRLQDSEEWHEISSSLPSALLPGIRAGHTYEYRVAGFCDADIPTYNSHTGRVSVPSEDTARMRNCGVLRPVDLSNQEPLNELSGGEQFLAGDFPVHVGQVSGSSGYFTGSGYVHVPFLGNAPFKVTFDHIFINTDRQMVRGVVRTVYDASEGGITDLDDIFAGGNAGDVKEGITKTGLSAGFAIDPGNDFYFDETTGRIEMTDDEGQVIGYLETGSVPGGGDVSGSNNGDAASVFPVTVRDTTGHLYRIDSAPETSLSSSGDKKKLTVTSVGTSGEALDSGQFDAGRLDDGIARVVFKDCAGSLYAFDEWHPSYSRSYLIRPKYEQIGADYRVPAKLLPSGKSDKVAAVLKISAGSSVTPDRVVFRTAAGTEYRPESYDAKSCRWILPLVGGKENDGQELYALYPKPDGGYYNLGKLLVLSYPSYRLHVKIVPVGKDFTEFELLAGRLREIYGRVGIECVVEKIPVFDYEGSGLFDGESGLFSAYTPGMKSLNAAYASSHTVEEDAAYLFVLSKSGYKKDRNFSGFMPLGKQFGYLFRDDFKSFEDFATAAAHELGHGRLLLRHPFDKSLGLSEGDLPDNLMDYRNGRSLAKWQWDVIHDPGVVVRIFERDEDGAIVDNTMETGDLVKGENIGLTPAGKVIFNVQSLVKGEKVIFLLKPNMPYIYGFKIYTDNSGKEEILEEYFWTGNTYKSSNGSIEQSSKVRLTYNDRDDIETYIYRIVDACYYQKAPVKIKGVDTGNPTVLNSQAKQWKQLKKHGGNCPEISDTETYFALENPVAEEYLRYAEENAIEINDQLWQHNSVVEKLVEIVKTSRGSSEKYKQLLGKVIADKLYTYELAHPDSRFIVACCPVNVMSTAQSSWSQLAESVFRQSGLSEHSILITVPYVHTAGIGQDKGTYFFMPGIACGKSVQLDRRELGNRKYTNTRRVAEYEAKNEEKLPFADFVFNVFKYTAKPEIVYSYFLGYRGEIVATNRMENPERVIGKEYIYKLIVAEDSRIDDYVAALEKFYANRNVCISENPFTGQLSARTTLPSAYRNYAESQERLLNFLRDHPAGIFREVEHGLFDSAVETEDREAQIGKQFVFWYRDHKFSGYCSQIHKGVTASPAHHYFVSGKNAVVYRETLSGIDALGALLMPFGLDFVADGAGALYAGYYDDWENMAVYSSALIIPVAPAIATKGIAGGTKAVLKSAKGLELADKVAKANWNERMFSHLSREWKSEGDLLTKLEGDLASTPQLFDIFADELKIEGAYAWRIVNSYADLRKNPKILEVVSNLLSDERFCSSGLTPELLEGLISGNHGVGATALEELLSGYKVLVASGTKFENIGAMIAEFKKGLNFAEGERWIQRYFLSHPEEFKGRVITFESQAYVGSNVRRVDVVTTGENNNSIYYEFKSITHIPPKNFARQFLKDLEVAENLEQIKWYFDGKKISNLDKELFLEELEKVEIKRELIEKWINDSRRQSKDYFINFVSTNFELIYKIR